MEVAPAAPARHPDRRATMVLLFAAGFAVGCREPDPYPLGPVPPWVSGAATSYLRERGQSAHVDHTRGRLFATVHELRRFGVEPAATVTAAVGASAVWYVELRQHGGTKGSCFWVLVSDSERRGLHLGFWED